MRTLVRRTHVLSTPATTFVNKYLNMSFASSLYFASTLFYTDPMVPAQRPPEPITVYQCRLQSNLQHILKFADESWTERKDNKHLDHIFTELHIPDGSDVYINIQNEVMQIEMTSRRPTAKEKPIQLCSIFKHPTGDQWDCGNWQNFPCE